MSDLQYIYLILAVFYVAECGYWIRPGSLVFGSQLGGRCRPQAAHTGAWLRNDRGGFVLGNLLPLGHSLLAYVWPVSLSPAGVVSAACQILTPDGRADGDEVFLAWEAVKDVTADGRQVRVAGRPFVRAATPDAALRLATLLRQLAATPPEGREAAIDRAIRAWLNADKFAALFQRQRRWSLVLMLPCAALFLYLFVLTPILYEYFIYEDFLAAVPAYLALLAVIIVTYHFVHAILGGPAGLRWSNMMTMLFSPADAMHARDKLYRHVGGAYHPLALASVVCAPPVFRDFARDVVLDLRHPLPLPPGNQRPPEAVAVEAWFRARLEAATEEFLEKNGIDPETLIAPPEPDQGGRSYCPRCLGQYVIENDTCSMCGLALQSFAAPKPPRAPRVKLTAPVVEPEPEPAPVPAAEPAKVAVAAAKPQAAPGKPAGKRKRRKKK